MPGSFRVGHRVWRGTSSLSCLAGVEADVAPSGLSEIVPDETFEGSHGF